MSGIVTTKKQALAYLKATRERYGLLTAIEWLLETDPTDQELKELALLIVPQPDTD